MDETNEQHVEVKEFEEHKLDDKKMAADISAIKSSQGKIVGFSAIVGSFFGGIVSWIVFVLKK
mgnify:CR=1 FL=1